MLLERRGRVLAELAVLSYLSGPLPFVLVPRESFGGLGHAAFLAQRKDNARTQVAWRDTGLQEGPGTALRRVIQVPCSRRSSRGRVGFQRVCCPFVRTGKDRQSGEMPVWHRRLAGACGQVSFLSVTYRKNVWRTEPHL